MNYSLHKDLQIQLIAPYDSYQITVESLKFIFIKRNLRFRSKKVEYRTGRYLPFKLMFKKHTHNLFLSI